MDPHLATCCFRRERIPLMFPAQPRKQAWKKMHLPKWCFRAEFLPHENSENQLMIYGNFTVISSYFSMDVRFIISSPSTSWSLSIRFVLSINIVLIDPDSTFCSGLLGHLHKETDPDPLRATRKDGEGILRVKAEKLPLVHWKNAINFKQKHTILQWEISRHIASISKLPYKSYRFIQHHTSDTKPNLAITQPFLTSMFLVNSTPTLLEILRFPQRFGEGHRGSSM